MENIHEILKGIGIEVPEESKAEFDKAFLENYKTVNDYNKQKTKIDSLNENLKNANDKISELGETLKSYEGTDETITNLRAQVEDFKQKEQDRINAEKLEKEDAELTAKIKNEIGEVEFVNQYTEESIFNSIKKGLQEDTTKGAKQIFDELTKDKEGIFKNPQQVAIPKSEIGTKPTDLTKENRLREIMGLKPKGE